ncbi:chloride channel protein [Geoglobus ahangari]
MDGLYSKSYFLMLVILTGLVSGLGAILLYTLIDLANTFFLENLGNLYLPSAYGEVKIFSFELPLPSVPYFILPAVGGLISGLIVYSFAPEAEGHGTDAVIRAFHREKGIIRPRVPIVKAIATAFTIGSGGSAGREGPVAQIGAGFGSAIAQVLNLTDRERRLLLVSGIAGGIGGIFRSPLGGALFAVEVLYRRDTETEGLIYAFISSIISYLVLTAYLFQFHHEMPGSIFRTPDVRITGFGDVILFAITGVACAVVAVVYVKTFYFVHDTFKKFRIKNWLKPTIGGLITGIIAIAAPQTLGMGYGFVQLALDNKLALEVILLIIVGKILATSFTVASGGSGGVFAPSIVIGSMVGALIGHLAGVLFPGHSVVPSAFVIVGMGAFISAVAKTPITSIIMVLEMSGGYQLLPAIMTASAISYILSGDVSIYREQVETRADSPAHRRELVKDILEGLTVRDAMTKAEEVITVSPNNSLEDVLYLIQKTGHLGFPVTEDGRLVGIITLSDITRIPDEKRSELKVEDVMNRSVISVTPDENLENALKILIKNDIGRLPVVEEGRLVGIITRSDIMKAHARELARLGI